jgi:hypothetical protein
MPAWFSSRRIGAMTLAGMGVTLLVYAISDHPFYGGEPGFGRVQAVIAATGVGLIVCAALPSAVASRIALLAFSSIATLAFVEVAGEMLLGPRYRPIYQADERLLFKFVPGRRSVMTHAAVNGGETVSHRINSQGFRGDELRPAGERTRIVVYGYSFIHAFYTADEDTFVTQLGKSLAARIGKPVEAINAGVSSYGPDQIALRMPDELGRLRPDLVVVAIYAGNDYGDLLRNKIFRLREDGALVENRATLDSSIRVWLDLNQRESILVRTVRAMRGRGSAAAQGPGNSVDIDFLLAEAEREYRSSLQGGVIVTNTHVDYYSADVSLTPRSASAQYKVKLMRANTARIKEIAGKNGTPLVFLFIPHPADVAGSHDLWPPFDRKRFPDYDGRNQMAPLEHAAKSLGVPFLSLYDLYREHGAHNLYLRGGDDHWNAAGQRLAAQAMVDLVSTQALLRIDGKAVSASGSAGALPQPAPGR